MHRSVIASRPKIYYGFISVIPKYFRNQYSKRFNLYKISKVYFMIKIKIKIYLFSKIGNLLTRVSSGEIDEEEIKAKKKVP